MMREPWFWRSRSMTAKAVTTALSPLATLYDFGQRARWRMTKPATTNAPVICVGNATLGGVGKTPFAIALFDLLQAEGVSCRFLTRGYGGAARGPLKVDLAIHNAQDVGDEALLLARHGPVFVSANRPRGADAAAGDGARAIIMDDGFQNPTIRKAFSILLIDADDTDGNGLIFPAGPLREPLARARLRADIVIHIGQSQETAQRAAEEAGSPYAAWLEPCDMPSPQKVVAFSGIGKPEKFFTTLRQNGFDVAEAVAFPDHHPFTVQDLTALSKLAAKHKAALIATEKDHVRLPPDIRDEVLVLPVRMRINKPDLLTQAILSTIKRNPGANNS